MDQNNNLSKIFHQTLTLNPPPPPSPPPHHDDEPKPEPEPEPEPEEEDNNEFEFSFMSENLSSPVAAEEVFKDGQIRIMTPIYGEGEPSSTTAYDPKVKKVFIVEHKDDDVVEDEDNNSTYCIWKSPVPEMSQKSNSTGFSKLWKMRDLLARSNSDGKDAFVFLTGETTSFQNKKKGKLAETTSFQGEKKEKKNKKKNKSVYEELYGGNEKKKGGGKSYLPYKQDLVGFFTNGSSLSRNVHPY